MKKAKKTLKRGFALLCALLCVLPALSGVALASQRPVATAVPLGSIHDTASAVQAVEAQAASMLGELAVAGNARYLSLYAEGALAQSGAEQVKGDTLTIDAEAVNNVRSKLDPDKFQKIVDDSMRKEDIEPFGGMSVIAEFQMSTPDILVHIRPDVVSVTSVDTILIKTPFYDLSFCPEDLADDLNETLTIGLKDTSETLEPRIEVEMTRENLAGFLTLSLPNANGDLPELAVIKEGSEESIVSSYNNVTEQISGLISLPGAYRPGLHDTAPNGKSFERKFTDADKLKDLQLTAAKYVYGKGIMDGYGDNTFRPSASVTRGQFVKIMMYAIGHKYTRQPAQYPDVRSGAYYYYPAGIAQKRGYMQGYEDGRFHPDYVLNKAQICTILGRILMKRKGYKSPASPSAVIAKYYDDMAPEYSRPEVALLLNLGILRDSGRTFNRSVNRIYVVEMLYRAFNKNYL